MIFVPVFKEYNYFQLVQSIRFLVLFECTLFSPLDMSQHLVELLLFLILKSDIGTWTFNLINIGSCNSKSSIMLVKDINEYHSTGIYL